MNESPDLWVMFRPAQAFPHLLKDPAGGRWMAVRRPLFLILILAAFASLATSGRLSLRLLTAGAECAVFLPPLMIGSLALIRRPAIPLARAIDLFFLGHGPWTLWIVAFASVWAFVPAAKAFSWFPYREAWLAAAVAAFLWSSYIDFWFLRCVFRKTAAQALRDLAVQRTIAWIVGLAVFVGAGGWQVLASRFGW
jgi:hypothetical protein